MKKLLSSLVLAGVMATGALAQDIWPVDISFLDWIHRPADVAGLRLAVPYGINDSVTGLDIGLWGKSDYAWAIQINVLHNKVRDEMGGIQISCLNDAGHLTGMQIGLWNTAPTMEGFQIGLLNLADQVDGLQIGLINRTEIMKGYQIGLVNVIRESSVPFAPVINFHL
ncbi:MAG: hypothetical protein WCI17_05345 [bacterium]